MSTTKPEPTKPIAEPKMIRGPGVPTVSLPKAIELIRKIWEKEKRNLAPVAAIMTHWGYKPKSSGGFLAIAALKRYGLLEEQGNNEKRSLKLSQAALDLLKSETTNPQEYQRMLKVCALRPLFHANMWKKYADELPSDETLKSHLVFDDHLSEDAATAFIRQYKDTIQFAKLTQGDTIPDKLDESEEVDSETEDETGSVPDGQKKTDFSHSKPPVLEKEKSVQTQIQPGELPIPLGDGRIARVPFPISAEAFELLLGSLNLWRPMLVKKAGSIPPEIAMPANAMWKAKDSNRPVKIVRLMGEKNGEIYYQSEDGTGIPASQLVF